jgi:hypothetical protein
MTMACIEDSGEFAADLAADTKPHGNDQLKSTNQYRPGGARSGRSVLRDPDLGHRRTRKRTVQFRPHPRRHARPRIPLLRSVKRRDPRHGPPPVCRRAPPDVVPRSNGRSWFFAFEVPCLRDYSPPKRHGIEECLRRADHGVKIRSGCWPNEAPSAAAVLKRSASMRGEGELMEFDNSKLIVRKPVSFVPCER